MYHPLARIPSCKLLPRSSTHMPPTPILLFTTGLPLLTVMAIVCSSRPFHLIHGHFAILNTAPMYSVTRRSARSDDYGFVISIDTDSGFTFNTLSIRQDSVSDAQLQFCTNTTIRTLSRLLLPSALLLPIHLWMPHPFRVK
ncbi:hypothetical protein BDR04DRAFT_726309 [Suillus decipiens]|nr:hypothetical protein BDR04DRAFT_726309 [Suillus decipiens]